MSLKEKTISGLFWSFIDKAADYSIQFIIGITLARLLSPRDFGLIGMMMVFIAISQSLVDSGFSQALIRKKNCTQYDYSTVFYSNLIIGITIYLILFFSSATISTFFKEPELQKMIKVFSLIIIVEALTITQRTILTKQVNFKLQARISVLASLCAGIFSILSAYFGFGVWSLVILHMSKRFLNSLMLWLWNRWRPLLVFSMESFSDLFNFGSKLMISGLINNIFKNIYHLIIGKFFSTQTLGYFTRADEFKKIPSQNLTSIIQRVSYPILSQMKDDTPRLRRNYQKLIRSTMFITFSMMLGMAAVSEAMIITLIGEKWRPSIVLLQMLCIIGMMFPLHALNLNILQVQGRSDLFLKLEIIKKIIRIPTIILGIIFGIKVLILGMIFNTFIAFFLNSFYSGQLIGYTFGQQVKDIMPAFAIALLMSVTVFTLGNVLPFESVWVLIVQICVGIMIVIGTGEIVRFKDYLFLKSIIIEKFTTMQRFKVWKTKIIRFM